ncbi:MAG: VWA domain-containing protein, partial [Pirellulaceae bacterium]
FSLSPDESCTVEVGFTPGDDDFAEFSAALFVENKDPNPTIARALSGTFAEIQSINVAINQVNACPRDPARVFVSVTDGGGFPVTGLQPGDFTLAEDDGAGGGFGTEVQPAAADTIGSAPFDVSLSASLLMDYSGSIAGVDEFKANMEDAAKTLVNSMTAGDEAEVIKYSSNIEITQPFTEDVSLLLDAIDRDPSVDGDTALYDAVDLAVENITERLKPRKAVIALTDGGDNVDNTTLQEAINAATTDDVPVITIGFGEVEIEDLQSLAAGTGGVFYNPPASDNLDGTYQQVANLLFKDQYVLTYGSGLPAEGGRVRVSAGFEKSTGEIVVLEGAAVKAVRACQP